MNRSALIVIVDFLLISLLAFSRFDDQDTSAEISGTPTIASSSGHQDVVDVLKMSLNQEKESREQLNEQLRQTQAQLQTREKVLGDRERLIRDAEQVLAQKADEATRLSRERAALEQQYFASQASARELQKQLTNTITEASLSRQHLEAVRSDLEARAQEEAILKRKMAELEKTREAAEAEKQQLATQLQVAEAEKRLVREQLDTTQGEVLVEREEKAKVLEHANRLQEHATKMQEHATKLAEGVTVLAEKSGELSHNVSTLAEKSGELKHDVTALAEKSTALTQEIRENRPLAPNTVFNEFVTNRVRGDFRAVRSGVFGREINREKEAKTVLVRQGAQVYALFHVNDTPVNFSFPGIDWDWLIGNLRRGNTAVRAEKMSFLAMDPRVLVIPVPEAKAKELGSKIYTIPKDPFKFQDAILVGANEGYYGECKFQLDAENPQYIRMQRERFSWLVGKFAPSSGDLVFTKGGELLGLMVNKEYCLLLGEFSPAYHIQMGIGIAEQQTGLLLSQLYGQVSRMPGKLQ